MKKLFLLLCCLVVAFTAMASKNLYCVEGASVLNVRAKSSTSAPILGTLKEGERVEVSWVDEGGWAEILYQGDFGYVSAKYIRKLDRKEASKLDLSGIECVEGGFFAKLEFIEDRFDKAELHTNWTLFIIIPLIILLFVFIEEWEDRYWLFMILMFVLTLFEIYYALGVNAFDWQAFLNPFWWSIVRVVLELVINVVYVIFMAMQFYTYFIVEKQRYGILNMLPIFLMMFSLFIMAVLDCSDEAVLWVVVSVLALQVILLFVKDVKRSYKSLLLRMIGAFIYPLLYVITTLNLCVYTYKAIIMALTVIVVVALVGLLVSFIGSGSGSGSSSESGSESSGDDAEIWRATEGPSGRQLDIGKLYRHGVGINGRFINPGEFLADNGELYRRDSDGWHKV
ncbi:MAG: SH3 domain-containing protein [Alistipes sp.]|nr:SH3 domain-containing protein [Alistipes sp.]